VLGSIPSDIVDYYYRHHPYGRHQLFYGYSSFDHQDSDDFFVVSMLITLLIFAMIPNPITP
jgi:hypothetical protein